MAVEKLLIIVRARRPQIAEWVISTWLASQHNLYSYVERMKKGVWEADHISTVDDSVGRRMYAMAVFS